MIASQFSAIRQLEAQRKIKPARPAPDPQVAVVGMLPGILGDVLSAMSRNKQPLPKSVPGYGALPPGDVVNIHHFTEKPFDVLDPAQWSTRSPTAPRKNLESAWVTPEHYPVMTYLPDYGYTKEQNLFTKPTRLIEGGVPGMYNASEDPLGLHPLTHQRVLDAAGGGHVIPAEFKREFAREIEQRGYTGYYAPDAPQGGAAMMFDLIDTRPPGNYPNIAQIRQDLGLSNEPGQGLFPIRDADVASVTTETQPGKALIPHRYRNYENDQAASWLLHRDYERLLRNPDSTSVVAKYFDTEAPVFQGQGYFKGQRNPVSGARMAVDDPKRPLTDAEKQKLDAIALTEGVLRDQDAAAWSRPYDLTDKPKTGDKAVLLESPTYGVDALKTITNRLEAIPLGQYKWGDEGETFADHAVIVPNPNGSPGVFVFKIDDNIPDAYFRAIMDGIIAREKKALGYGGVAPPKVRWGKYDSRYIDAKQYGSKMKELPADLQMRVVRAVQDLTPAVSQVRSYHDSLRSKNQRGAGAVPGGLIQPGR